MLITKNFEDTVLLKPAEECNKLNIITAFVDCDKISTHLIKLQEGIMAKRYPKSMAVEILVGMAKSSISVKKHNDICRLLHYLNGTRNMPTIGCRYICDGPEVHSKVYVWSKDRQPEVAYCGSLNYTMNAFFKRRESVTTCNPQSAIDYYNSLMYDSVDYNSGDAETRIKAKARTGDGELLNDSSEDEYAMYDAMKPEDTICISLLTARGDDTGYGSGVNWGIRPNGQKRDPNQAYIPYNKKDRKPEFFPDRVNVGDTNCPMFKVITKEFGSFHMRVAQQGNKAIQSVESNAILGEMIRKKVNCALGGYVTKQMLENYGKTYVEFRKYSDGVYLLDF